MGVGAAITGAVSVGVGLYKSYKGKKEQRAAQDAIDNYERQELTNAYDNLSVSTLGADLRREELSRSQATSTEALRSAGARGILGGLGQVQQQGVQVSREIGADLDQQQKQIDQLRAQDDVRIRETQELRERDDLAGLGQQLAAGQKTQNSGFQDIVTGINFAGNALDEAGGFKKLKGEGANNSFNPNVKQEDLTSPLITNFGYSNNSYFK